MPEILILVAEAEPLAPVFRKIAVHRINFIFYQSYLVLHCLFVVYYTWGVAKGGGIWGSNPPIGPNFLVIFTKTLMKRRSGAYLQRFRTLKTPSFGNFWPQNPLLRPFLATPLLTGDPSLSYWHFSSM